MTKKFRKYGKILRKDRKKLIKSLKEFIKKCTVRVKCDPEIDDPTTDQFFQIYKNWCKENFKPYMSYLDFKDEMIKKTGEFWVTNSFGDRIYFKYIIPTDEVKNRYGIKMGVFGENTEASLVSQKKKKKSNN